jgi:hypothetical protein
MKRSLSLLVLAGLLAVSPAGRAGAQDTTRVFVTDRCEGCQERFRERRQMREARFAITTPNEVAVLMLTRDAVTFQLTDEYLHDIKYGLPEDRLGPEAGFLERMAAWIVRRTVHFAMNDAVEYPLRDLRGADYRDGRLVFVTSEGRRAFQEVRVNDTDAMHAFTPADARAFVRAFRAAKARAR